MILDNRTRYRSADLEAVILKALKEAGIESHARDRVLVNASPRGFSGWCYFGHVTPRKLRSGGREPRMVLRLPDPDPKRSTSYLRIVSGRCPTHGVASAEDGSAAEVYGPGSVFMRCPRGCRFMRPATVLPDLPPPPPFDVGLFVWLVRHEVGHWRGLDHKQMAPLMRHRKLWLDAGRPLPDWAAEVSVALEDAPAPRSRKKVRVPDEDREKRAEHARKMLARAERKAKLAATLEKRWRRRLAAAERAILKAAQGGRPITADPSARSSS